MKKEAYNCTLYAVYIFCITEEIEKRMKNILITGASKGIGLATVKAFLKKDYKVFAHYYQTFEPLNKLKNEIKNANQLILLQADLRQKSGIDLLFSQIDENIDVLVNNAAISENILFDQITEEKWDEMLSLNLKTYFLCAQKVFPGMLHQKSGSIINISSIWGVTGAAMEVHYSTAKAGVIGLTKALAKELAPSHILVNAVAPGVIDTDMLKSFDDTELENLKKEIPLERFGRAEEVADLILYLVEQKYITGEVININGGLWI